MTYDNNPNTKAGNNMSSSDSNTDDIEVGRYGPLAHINTAESRLPAFGGEFQPGLYRPVKDRKIANPAPLGLCGFALTTFMLGCIQMNVRGLNKPNFIVGPALAYGGLVQLLSGMWYVMSDH
jgi:succinate-acetate transporter protein